jgi:hypothetical protein
MAAATTTTASNVNSPIYQPLTPLSPSQKLIRLLRILPGCRSETLKCELQVTDLVDSPQFEALSYVWGNPEPAAVVFCNGQPKKVTPNLGRALLRLRYDDRERLVWIDAICVNQDDLLERSEQVKLMRDIYSQAWRVVVWLGEDEGEYAETAIRIIQKATEYCYSEIGASLEDLSDGDHLDIIKRAEELETEIPWSEKKKGRDFPPSKYEVNDSRSNTDWAAVSKLYSNTWFTRIWIVQEVAFAPAILCIGNHEVGWPCVAAAARWLLSKDYSYNQGDGERYRQAWSIYFLRLIIPRVPLALQGLLNFVKSNSTDPRDKIFGLLGLLDEERRASSSLQPDYTKDVVEVYVNTMRYIIKENDPEAGLGNLLASFREAPEEHEERFPSWVFRWDLTAPESSFFNNAHKALWSACGRTVQEVAEVTDPRTLSLKGINIGVIKKVNHVLCTRKHELDRVQLLWNEVSTEFTSHQESGSLEQAFVETITAEDMNTSDGDTTLGARGLVNYLSIADWNAIYSMMNERGDSISKAIEFLIRVNAKAFLITGDAHMALGAIVAQPGDVLCVFFGHHMPYLLRPTAARYRFLGPCYVHGYMRGAAVDKLNRGDLKEEWFELE